MYLYLLDKKEKILLLKLLVLMANADGVVTEGEAILLDEYKKELNLEGFTPKSIAPVDDICEKIENERSKRVFILELLDMAMIDGRFHEKEKELINRVGKHLGLSGRQIEEFVRWLKRSKKLDKEIFTLIHGFPLDDIQIECE